MIRCWSPWRSRTSSWPLRSTTTRKATRGPSTAPSSGQRHHAFQPLPPGRRGVWPDLAVIDGFESMEGHGPAWGTPLATRLALASTDPLAADVVGTTIMGFDPGRILYLKAMTEAGLGQGDSEKIRIVGAPLDECRFKFKVGEKMAEILSADPRGPAASPARRRDHEEDRLDRRRAGPRGPGARPRAGPGQAHDASPIRPSPRTPSPTTAIRTSTPTSSSTSTIGGIPCPPRATAASSSGIS